MKGTQEMEAVEELRKVIGTTWGAVRVWKNRAKVHHILSKAAQLP